MVTRDDGSFDAQGVISEECYKHWMQSRKTLPSCPEKSFQRTLSAHLTGVDGRTPFRKEEEIAILSVIRKKQRWPCFQNSAIKFGEMGFRAKGFHEKLGGRNVTTAGATRIKKKRTSMTHTAGTSSFEDDNEDNGEYRDDDDFEEGTSLDDGTSLSSAPLTPPPRAGFSFSSSPSVLEQASVRKRKFPTSSSVIAAGITLRNEKTAPPLLSATFNTARSKLAHSSIEAACAAAGSIQTGMNMIMGGGGDFTTLHDETLHLHYEDLSAAAATAPPAAPNPPSTFGWMQYNELRKRFRGFAESTLNLISGATSDLWQNVYYAGRFTLLSRGWVNSPSEEDIQNVYQLVMEQNPHHMCILADLTERNFCDRFVAQSPNSLGLFGPITRATGGTKHMFFSPRDLWNMFTLFTTAMDDPSRDHSLMKAMIKCADGRFRAMPVYVRVYEREHLFIVHSPGPAPDDAGERLEQYDEGSSEDEGMFRSS